jgi:hypothetical protein
MIDLLPQDILIDIFALLPRQDLISLTKTCKYFNESISENSNLCKNLELHFVPENSVLEWTGRRRYTRAYIEALAARHFMTIFENFGANLREIQVICMKTEAAVLKKILMSCRNVVKLVLKDNNVRYNLDDFDEPLPRLQLQTFHYRNFFSYTSQIFKLFKRCTVKDLIVVGHTGSCDDLKDFMKTQEKLEIFSLQDIQEKSSIFCDENFFSSSKFRLKKLALDKVKIDDGLKNFMDIYVERLAHLELNEIDQKILKITPKFTKIQKLKIFEMKFREPTPMPQVTHLTIGYDVTGMWAANFTNIRTLKITWIRFQSDLVQIEQLKHLETLHVDFCCLPELNIPSVKSLRLTDVGYAGVRPFRIDNNGIEELFIDHCTSCEWLVEYLDGFARSLKLLQVKDTKMSGNCERILDVRRDFVVRVIKN